jgi:hypothetical protein
MHEAVRAWVREHVSPVVAEQLPILYGGAFRLLLFLRAGTDALSIFTSARSRLAAAA